MKLTQRRFCWQRDPSRSHVGGRLVLIRRKWLTVYAGQSSAIRISLRSWRVGLRRIRSLTKKQEVSSRSLWPTSLAGRRAEYREIAEITGRPYEEIEFNLEREPIRDGYFRQLSRDRRRSLRSNPELVARLTARFEQRVRTLVQRNRLGPNEQRELRFLRHKQAVVRKEVGRAMS